MGKPSVFLRLAGCNLLCGGRGTQHDGALHDGATWRCDTIELWMKGQSKTYEEVFSAEQLQQLRDGAHLVITGGEPLLQQDQLAGLLDYLKENGAEPYTEVETNGTIASQLDLDQYNVSPKLSNSGVLQRDRYKLEVLKALSSHHSQFKFVISREDDWKEIEDDFSFIPAEKIWLMPAGEDQSKLAITRPIAVELAKKHGVNYSDRLQIVVWNRKTGV